MVAIRAGVIPDDIEMCAQIWVRAIEHRDGFVDAEARSLRVRSAFANPVVRFAVATSPRVGFALTESGQTDPAEALLHFLAVDPEGLGTGSGAALLVDAAEHATASGFTSLVLEARADYDRAIELYKRTGFKPYGKPIRHQIHGYVLQSYRLTLV